jgi:hypothetical protein
MNKKTILTFLAFALFFFATNFADAQTVYVTESGKKFHMKNCSVAKTGKTGMEYSEAKKKCYTPCGVCKPDDKKTGILKDEPKKVQ